MKQNSKAKDHEHCHAGTTCWQGNYPCPEGGKNPLKAQDTETITFEVRVYEDIPGGAELTRSVNYLRGRIWVRYAGSRYFIHTEDGRNFIKRLNPIKFKKSKP